MITDGRIVSVVGRGGARPDDPGRRAADRPAGHDHPARPDRHARPSRLARLITAPYQALQFTDLFQTVMGPGHARDMLEAGFTTVRNVGSDNYADVAYMQAIDEGRHRRARASSRPPTRSARPAAIATRPSCRPPTTPPIPASATARRRCATGSASSAATAPQVIKVCATGGVFSRNTEPGQQQLSEEELRAIAEEAHQWGLQGRRPRPWRRRHPRRDPRRHRHDRACQPDRRRRASAWRASAAPGSSWTSTTPNIPRPTARENGILEDNLQEGPRDRADPARQFPRRPSRRRAHGLRHRRRRDAARARRAPVPLDGRIWDDADGGDPVGDAQRRAGAGPRERTSARSRPAATPTSSRSPAIRSPTSAQLESVDVVIKGGAIVADRR